MTDGPSLPTGTNLRSQLQVSLDMEGQLQVSLDMEDQAMSYDHWKTTDTTQDPDGPTVEPTELEQSIEAHESTIKKLEAAEKRLLEVKNAFLCMCEEGELEYDVDADFDEGHWTNLSKWIVRTDPMWFDDFCLAAGITEKEIQEVKK